ncbi:phosphonopyruvate decarboxylase [Nisaea acidiphila]|uniref:Phosphonopyruvate decarboxylase n=1 Tax=Nisaea acidiphila TaxID=1862145 RepID=A0A9J7ARG9_9PROT|nr:phosphonopyruvate decarboxylase [Nisaea acidiphila]UUX49798.1 phosphonopyruvate decarboxylase [Nisaea acidiphila]
MSGDWSARAHELFKEHEIKQVAYVPDAGLSKLIKSSLADNDIRTVPLTTEEEGIAVSAGAWLGGQKCAVMMQSSGVGNTINMIASLTTTCAFPLFMIVTMRGDYGESNPWQMPMGKAVQPVLEAVGVRCIKAETDEEAAEAIKAGLLMSFHGGEAVAVLIGQKLIGAKPFAGAHARAKAGD